MIPEIPNREPNLGNAWTPISEPPPDGQECLAIDTAIVRGYFINGQFKFDSLTSLQSKITHYLPLAPLPLTAMTTSALRWIPVDQQLPKESEIVYAWNGRDVHDAWHYHGFWADRDGGVCGVTHWMPQFTPEPPKVDTAPKTPLE